MWNISKSIFSLVCLFTFFTSEIIAQTQIDSNTKIVTQNNKSLRIGIDLIQPIVGISKKNQNSFEIEIVYALKNNIFAALETGYGTAKTNTEKLNYQSHNLFFRLGLDKNFLSLLSKKDVDIAFIGFRYGLGPISRSSVQYNTVDSLWGNTAGIINARSTMAHWAGFTAGIKVDFWKQFYTGWTIHTQVLLNPKSFSELAPANIAGYGSGDKNVAYNFNFYIGYSLNSIKKNKKQH